METWKHTNNGFHEIQVFGKKKFCYILPTVDKQKNILRLFIDVQTKD